MTPEWDLNYIPSDETECERARRRGPITQQYDYEGTWRFRPSSAPPVIPVEVTRGITVDMVKLKVILVCSAILGAAVLALETGCLHG